MAKDSSIVESWLDDEESSVESYQPERDAPREPYRKRLVAWIDILGMRQMIKDYEKNDAESIFEVMTKLRNFVQAPCDYLAKEDKLHYTQVADGFLIVADDDCATEFCAILSNVQWQVLIECQMLLRGAITAGMVSVSDDPQIIIGPAYIDAYKLESEHAIYPRIILTKEFFDFTEGLLSFDHIATDTDKEMYLDFFKYAIEEHRLDTKAAERLLKEQGILKILKEKTKQPRKSKPLDRRVAQKYGWLASKLESKNIKIR
ncbi:MAG: hypothetical protein FWB97_05505 [Oscillospiraceae bacterium]|nr:hypothetical protein [Oscillospiraceae bacterium]